MEGVRLDIAGPISKVYEDELTCISCNRCFEEITGHEGQISNYGAPRGEADIGDKPCDTEDVVDNDADRYSDEKACEGFPATDRALGHFV